MKITEVAPETQVTVEVQQGVAKIQLTSKAIKSVRQGLLVECIRSGDKVINFETDKRVIYHMYIIDSATNKVRGWKDVQITRVSVKGKNYHLIVSKADSKPVNRRDSFRVYIGIKGIAHLGNHRNACEVMVKDLSESGISLITKDEVELNFSTPMRVSFVDTGLKAKFDLSGIIVRKEALQNECFLYGCTLNNKEPNSKLSNYLAQKQREKVKYTRFRVEDTRG